MWTVISVLIITVTAIYGITEMFRELWIWLLKPKNSPPAFFTVVLENDCYKEQLRYAEEYISWEGHKQFSGIIVIDSFLSDENKISVRNIINQKHNITTFYNV